MHPLLRFSLYNLKKSKARTGLAILAVILGVLLITALLVLTDSLVNTVDDSLEILSGTVIVQEKNALDPSQSFINRTIIDDILELNETGNALEGKIDAYAEEIWYGTRDNNSEFGFAQVIGIVPSQEIETVGVLNESNIIFGRTLNDDDKNATVIGVTVALGLEVIPGMYINISGFAIEVVGIFETESFVDASFYMPIETVRLFREQFTEEKVSAIMIKPADVDAEAEIIRYINVELGDKYMIEASDIDQLAEQGREFLEITTDFAFYIGIISVVIGSLSVFNAILMSVSERKKEIAVLKATGWTDNEVAFEVFLESLIIGIVGGIIGLGLGVLVALYVTNQSSFLDLLVIPLTLVKSYFYAVLLGIFAGLYPALRAMSIDPVTDLVG